MSGLTPYDIALDAWREARNERRRQDEDMYDDCGLAEAANAVAAHVRAPLEVRIAALESALKQIADASAAPDNWKPYGHWGDYNTYYDNHGEQGVDDSNSGDVHSHGYACGEHAAALIARAALKGGNTPAIADPLVEAALKGGAL